MSIIVVVIKLKLIGDLMQYLQLYGLNGLSNVMPLPIQANRAPTVLDGDAILGQEWQDGSTGDMYIFGGNIAGVNYWKAVGANAGGIFTTITVSGPGGSSLNGAFLINSGTASSTTISAGASTGNVGIINGTGTGVIVLGNALAGNISLTSGGTISTAGITSLNASANFATNINTGTSTGAVIIKNSTGTGDVSLRVGSGAGDVHIADGTSVGTVAIGNGNTTAVSILNNITSGARTTNIAAAGNTAAFADTVNISSGVMNNAGGSQVLNLADGNLTTGTKTVNIGTGNRAAGTQTVNISTGTGTKTVNVGNADALTVINLISPVTIGAAGSPTITSGAGAPAGNQPKGSLYLRTDGIGVNDRMYVATDAVGTWTAVVTVA